MKSIEHNTIEEAWCELFLAGMHTPTGVLGATAITVNIQNSANLVNWKSPIVSQVNKLLREKDKPGIRETANTIFPFSEWNIHRWDIDELSNWFLNEYLPRLKANPKPHARKSYFERMVNFGKEQKEGSNQLKFLLENCASAAERHTHFRRSGMQIAIFDPLRDHTKSAQKNFPCLQQLGIHFLTDGSLGVSAYYPTQFILERAYGNYIGICQLGHFLATQLKIEFKEFVCFIGSPRLGKLKKGELSELAELVNNSHES